MAGQTKDIINKTASYTVLPSDEGAIFTNRGASGTIVLTLPDSTGGIQSGWFIEYYTCAAQSITVTSATTDTETFHADLTGDSITTAATIGQAGRVIFDGTSYLVISWPSAASTATAVTAVTLAT
jgi:hypothetical protein